MTDLPGLLKALKIMTVMNGKAWRCSPAALDELNAAIAAERQRGEGREDLHDFMTHRDVWRGAMIHMRNLAVAHNDDANISYWTHEIEVFGKTMAAVDAALRASPSGTFAEGVEAAAKIACEEKERLQIARRETINRGEDSSCELWAMQTAAHIEKAIRALTPPAPPEVRGDKMSATADRPSK